MSDPALVEPFAWAALDVPSAAPAAGGDVDVPPDTLPPDPPPVDHQSHLAAIEREAFAKGYAGGERAGLEAGAKRADAMLRRLADTLDELSQLRARVIRQTERQMVELALVVARQVVTRELATHPDLVAALAHVALDRLGRNTPATIRLNPEDYSAVAALRGAPWDAPMVSVLPDPTLSRGGCVVESDFGVIDASADAQLAELSRALLDAPGDAALDEGVRV